VINLISIPSSRSSRASVGVASSIDFSRAFIELTNASKIKSLRITTSRWYGSS
jgi:hypothetical protein